MYRTRQAAIADAGIGVGLLQFKASAFDAGLEDTDEPREGSWLRTKQGVRKQLTATVGGVWLKTIINNNVEVEAINDVDVDPAGNLHVSYVATLDHILLYSTKMNGAFETYPIDTDSWVIYPPAITVGSDNALHIAYRVDTELRYAMMQCPRLLWLHNSSMPADTRNGACCNALFGVSAAVSQVTIKMLRLIQSARAGFLFFLRREFLRAGKTRLA